VNNGFQRRIETAATGEEASQAAEMFESMIPLRRHATPEEVAAPCSSSRLTRAGS
jgi:hypothetical protein